MLLEMVIFGAAFLTIALLALLVGYYFFGHEANAFDSTDLQAQREFGRWKQRQIENKAQDEDEPR
jgi:hypothetical protein